ncbi:MAG: hypothetical protein WCC41_07350 [Rhodomicrobium sp.]
MRYLGSASTGTASGSGVGQGGFTNSGRLLDQVVDIEPSYDFDGIFDGIVWVFAKKIPSNRS